MRRKANERADVTTDGQVSLSNGTLQRKRTLKRQYGWDCTRLDDVDVQEPGYMGPRPQI